MSDSFFSFVSTAVVSMASSQAGFFLSSGIALFRLLAILRLMQIGLWLLFPGGFPPVHVGAAILRLVVVAFLLGNWNASLPGMGGVAIHQAIPQAANDLSVRLDNGINQAVQIKLNKVYATTEMPGFKFSAWGSIVYYVVVNFAILAMRVVLVLVTALGYIATATLTILGPLAIPFGVFEGTSWVARNWFRSLVGYAFYSVGAAAATFVAGSFLLAFLDQNPGPYSLQRLSTMFLEMLVFLVGATAIILKLPSVVASAFGGRSGESSLRF